nr:universal stress protein a family protein c25b2.10 [Quercus suber]
MATSFPSSSTRNSTSPTTIPDQSTINQSVDPRQNPSSSASFVPAWRRPILTETDEAGRRQSVQFVPHAIKGDSSNNSRSSSARPPAARGTVALDGARPTRGRRLSSPPAPAAFRSSVSFDTFRNPSASDFSLTLNRKHRDYEYTKRSRTFLCGTDTNEYSDTALEWLIDELVDDGDEVVCLRVVDPDSKEVGKWSRGQGEQGYRMEAERFLEAIVKKNTDDRAISLVLEFSIGKVHDTIQQMIRLYEPAILVVGTRGRNLTGYHGLLSSGSVSKYCLQYSPVPVIVVRPSGKRESKKRKRLQDPLRTGYRDILDKSEDAPRGLGGHLLDDRHRMSVIGAELGALGELGPGDPDEEARKVAEAIGYHERAGRGGVGGIGSQRHSLEPSARGSSLSRTATESTDSIASPGLLGARILQSPELGTLDSPGGSDDDDDENETDHINSTVDAGPTAPADLTEQPNGWTARDEALEQKHEALRNAYERGQKMAEEELAETQEREERAARRRSGRPARSASRGPDAAAAADEASGAAVLGVFAQLSRGVVK